MCHQKIILHPCKYYAVFLYTKTVVKTQTTNKLVSLHKVTKHMGRATRHTCNERTDCKTPEIIQNNKHHGKKSKIQDE